MRPRFFIGLTLILLAALAILFWPRLIRHSGVPQLTRESASPTNSGSAIANNFNQNVSSQPGASPLPPAASKPESDDEKNQRIVQEANQAYEQPIELYGQVIDQDSNPLPNVKINASVLYEHMFMPTASGDFPITNNLAHLESETGMDGRFEINGAKGRNVTIESIQKDGYEVEADLCPHTFGGLSGTFDNPVVFKMWSTNIHEQLITGDKSFQIVPDGRPYFLNLSDGTISESANGDLRVWVKCTKVVGPGQLYDWSAQIDVIKGGLCPGDSYSMFFAPSSGYVPSFSLQQQIKDGQRGSIGDKKFYITLDNGKDFGRIQIDLIAPFNAGIPGVIRLSYAINPSGSRILR